jgi:uncharacterized protein
VTVLLDANVLIALTVAGSTFHERARAHLMTGGVMQPFATCSVTQGAFVRVLMGPPYLRSADVAFQALEAVVSPRTHSFWDDGFSYLDVPRAGLRGSRQVTDFWLAELARRRGGRLVTFDQGLAQAQPDVVELVP